MNHLAGKGLHHLTHWSFLVGEKQGAVITIHVSHADVVTICPIKLPGEESKQCMWKKDQRLKNKKRLTFVINFLLNLKKVLDKVQSRFTKEITYPSKGCTTRQWGLSNP